MEFDGRVVRGLDYYTALFLKPGILEKIHVRSWAVADTTTSRRCWGDPSGDRIRDGRCRASNCSKDQPASELDLQPAKVLITVFDNDSVDPSISLAVMLRKSGINALVYPDAAKLGKQIRRSAGTEFCFSSWARRNCQRSSASKES